MIVNYTEKGWQIISQKSHGLLAGQICFHWMAAQRPQRWFETLIAATEHDDASNEFEDEHILTETGGPLDFSMKKFDKAYYDRMISLSLTKSRYITLLNLKHIVFLHGNSDDRAARNYCKTLQKNQSAWLNETGMQADELDKAYEILEWCDALSLLICQNKIQPEERNTEISSGPIAQIYQLCEIRDHELKIEPWPFEPPRFSITYESKLLPTLKFKTAAAFRKELLETPVDVHNFSIVKK